MASPPTCLRRQKKDRNPPPIDESLGTNGVSSDLSRLPPQKNDRNPSQSTTLSVITASCPLVLASPTHLTTLSVLTVSPPGGDVFSLEISFW
ncbi:hypothetical protein Bca52824_065380 [Brassica carinata]|uniref:Uncharacterized protein n=1 Tax=Brassica carinata TaxID=52824 RepID=A0A8X7U949_BRACI|nr:hypothetical protein Bca52824_065380 [Brassica carinata]